MGFNKALYTILRCRCPFVISFTFVLKKTSIKRFEVATNQLSASKHDLESRTEENTALRARNNGSIVAQN